jgi:Large eukaryotic DNA virus major capsid protein/Major capsid protein N-terminus
MAGRASLAFLGQEDVVLSNLPEVTYFIEKYTGYTQFAFRVDEVQFQADYNTFGTESYSVLPKSGDLITGMHLRVTMPPQIPPGTSVLSSMGTLMIKYLELYVGSQLIERLWGEYIEMKMDLEVPASKQAALAALTGKNVTTALASYLVPIPFSCIERGLPLCAIDDDVTVRIVWYPASYFSGARDPIRFDSVLNVEYTYLSKGEVEHLKKTPQLFIFEQCQRVEFFTSQGTNTVTCPLQLVNPVKEIYFVIQNSSARGYDYSNVSGGTTDQLSNLALYFNTTERIQVQVGTPTFLRYIQALENHTRIPDRLFYMYSFSLDPESPAPSGHVNFSRIPQQILNISLNPSTDNRNIMIYASNYNFLGVDKGKVTLLFPNFES